MTPSIRYPRTTRRALACVAAVALLTGCATEAPDAAPPAEAPPASEAPAETAASGADCLHGTWKLRNDSFENSMTELVLNSPDAPPQAKGMSISISGDSYMRFDGVELYTAWQEAFTMTMTLNGANTQHVQDSKIAANYDASDEHVWINTVQVIEQSATMTLDGIGTVAQDSSSPGMASIDVFGYTGTIPNVDPEFVDGAAAYTCGPDELTLHSDAGMSAVYTRSE